ncbi:MAG: TonB-dependent receptor, partial [Bryobacterales bacterium]|nr:TonB-dependent receptor [Bryobacterales bacterium]
NDTGYYEANFLLPGDYRLTTEMTGFKRAVRSGIVLQISSRLDIDITLELGGVTESVNVTEVAPLIDTSAVSSGRVMDNRQVLDLPVIANNATVLAKLTPGVQTSGVNDYLGPHSNAGASDFGVNGRVGGNEYTLDGAPNNGAGRRAAFLPAVDTVSEIKVETSGFDASIGHSSGVSLSMMTRSGTNQYHGTATWQHWQQRWHATPFFTRQLYYQRIAAADAAGNSALANQLRNTDKQEPGRSNNWVLTMGGPVIIPKVFNGRNKLFFFFSYQGNIDKVSDLPSRLNRTIPTLDDRKGDFSRHLGANATLYQLHDPLSVRVDPARPRNFIRDPIPGNILPASRVVNPAYNFYRDLMPIPNNDPGPQREPLNNFLAVTTPLLRDYVAYTNRVDYNLSDRHRFFVRWSYNDWINDALDWTFDTLRGLHSAKQNRTNWNGSGDWVYTMGPATILDVNVSVNNYREGSAFNRANDYKAADVGLPAYLDQRAGDLTILPQMSFGGYETVSRGFPTLTHFRSLSARGDVSHIRGDHSLRAGMEARGQYRTGGGGGATTGAFGFGNNWTRRNDDTLVPAGNLAHSWAAFMMGLPNSAQIARADTYALLNPYYAWFAQDTWRVTPKLTVTLGFRLEYELGPNERYNRVIGWFDGSPTLPITAAAQAAYARSPIPELAASQFEVRGGSVYPGVEGRTRRMWRNEWMPMPRIAAAWQIAKNTVIRGGYGMFYDTINVLNEGPDQTGFSRSTTTVLTNDFGVNWLAGDPRRGISPLTDPFPIRSDGTRFDEPLRDSLGLMSRAGRGWGFNDFDRRHARQQRWRIGIQRQVGKDWLFDVAYVGSDSGRIDLGRQLSFLPEQYWASGQTRDNAGFNNLNANVTNPFLLSNFSALRTSNPVLYQDLSTQGFFTSPTIRKQQLLRAFPHINGLTNTTVPDGRARTHSMELQVTKRFSQGFDLNFGYTRLSTQEADFYFNEFDVTPAWRESNDGRPHRIAATGIYQLPFGKGRPFLQRGALGKVVGGFQAAATFEFQPGPLINWGNLFYRDDPSGITTEGRTLTRWFSTDGFERVANNGPTAFHRRVFPTRLNGVRADGLNQWNANLSRSFQIRESFTLQFRLDALNVQNRTQFASPNANPFSTDFGRVTAQTETRNRFIQAQVRLRW